MLQGILSPDQQTDLLVEALPLVLGVDPSPPKDHLPGKPKSGSTARLGRSVLKRMEASARPTICLRFPTADGGAEAGISAGSLTPEEGSGRGPT
jgi:hypothetical protein